MTAAMLQRAAAHGLRRVDPRRDMAGLADLIQVAFAERLDDPGRRMVAAMRAFGRWGWLGWAVGFLFLPPAAYPEGFVWLEEGRLVGNASLMRAEAGSRRWVLINVAVLPAWRRRGIASALVQGCLDEARRRAGRELWLQVDAANTGARDLYHRLGFRLTGVRATWRRTPWHSDSSASSEARARRPEEADDQLRLAERLCPEGVLWPLPLDRDTFRRSAPWGAIGHWVWPVGGPMQGFLSAFPGYETGGVQWVMMVDPQARGRAEGPLLDRALADWPHRARQMHLDTADESDGAILRSRGFTLERRLAWMTTNLAVPAEGSVPPEAGGGQHDDGG